jgi:hypothetical protein
VSARTNRVVASGPPSFELHTLGWRAFQDLCAAVIRTVWGQSACSFADSNDAGRDGAFYGIWHDNLSATGLQDVPGGPFVLQCKHTKKVGSTLSESDLAEEFCKVPALVTRGLCHSYVLMTNARVTGNAEEKIRGRLRDAGVVHPLVLDGQWVCDTIAAHRELRLFVPRVYGLGDLSQILDERAYAQASVLIAAARDQLAAFVTTEPYRKAARALQDHGFVLLLGEPAVGKSVTALMLALAAADSWGCATVKARTATELVAHWNPNEPGQFFWVDDAFGAFQHEEQLTSDWARSMDHVMSAVSRGARVVLTSRSYIYRDARPLLKEYHYPRLREQQVLIDVEDLTLKERKQILYNHIASGDQPAAVRAALKPFLDHAAAAKPFLPEMARRLGLRIFTSGLDLAEDGITNFMTRPRPFLRDIYAQLSSDQHAALALVFAATLDGSLENPPSLTAAQRDIIERAGSTPGAAIKALQALSGSFLQVTGPPLARPGWTFRHPTLWEGFASWLPTQAHLLTVLTAVLVGLDDFALLRWVDCGDENADEEHGILLRVPPALYPPMAARFAGLSRRLGARTLGEDGQVSIPLDGGLDRWERDIYEYVFLTFLSRRTSDGFLREYLQADPGLLANLVLFTSSVDAALEPGVLARLHRAGLLSEPVRRQAVDRMAHLAVSTPDAGWFRGADWETLLTPGDRSRLMDKARTELVPRLESDEGWGPLKRYPDGDPVEKALIDYQMAFGSENDLEAAAKFSAALEIYRQRPVRSCEDDSYWDTSPLGGTRLAPPPDADSSIFDADRSIFDDVDEM